MQDLPDMTVDQWNDVYIEVTEELYRGIAQQLIEEFNQNEKFHWELNEKFSKLAIENQVETLDPSNIDVAVCSLCKNNSARRVKETRIHCEMAGCVAIDLKFEDFIVEDIMMKLGAVVQEHKNCAQEEGLQCFEQPKNSEISIVELSEDHEFKNLKDDVSLWV